MLRETGNPSRALAKHGKASGGASYSGGGGSCGGGLGQAAAAAEKPKDYSDRSRKEKRRGKGSPRARIRPARQRAGASAMELGGGEGAAFVEESEKSASELLVPMAHRGGLRRCWWVEWHGRSGTAGDEFRR